MIWVASTKRAVVTDSTVASAEPPKVAISLVIVVLRGCDCLNFHHGVRLFPLL